MSTRIEGNENNKNTFNYAFEADEYEDPTAIYSKNVEIKPTTQEIN